MSVRSISVYYNNESLFLIILVSVLNPTKYCYRSPNKVYKTNVKCSSQGTNRKFYKTLVTKRKKEEHLRGLVIDERILLNRILKKIM
jgi:hypothetical protein